MTHLGETFVRAVAAKDAGAMRAVLHPDVDFRGLTPKRTWEAAGVDEVLDTVFGHWFDDSDTIEAVESVETDAFADRQRVGYRFRITNADGEFLVEQQAYLEPRDGRIGWMRVVCSGFRPIS